MLHRLFARLKSLRVSLMLIVLLCWLLPTLILGGYMGLRLSASLREQTQVAMLSSTRQAHTLLLANARQAISLARDATYDGEIAAAWQQYQRGELRYQDYFKTVRNYLDRKYGREDLFTFALFFPPDKPEEIHYTSQNYTQAALFQQQAQEQVLELCQSLDTRCRFLEVAGQAYLVRNLYDLRLERFGVLVLGCHREALLAPALETDMDGLLRYGVALDGVTLGTCLPFEGEGPGRQGELLLYTLTARDPDFTLVLQAQADRHRAYADVESLGWLLTGLLALLLPLCLGVTVYVQRRVARPIAQLSQAARQLQNGELGREVAVDGAEELRRLGEAFSSMSRQLKWLVDRSYKEQIALRDARIQALQSRINPHFLNNALEDINWQARLDGNETVARMVETLSVLLNAAIDRSDRHLVRLGEELRIAEAYFFFVELRFGQRMAVERQVEEGLEGALIPRLVVQVLAENAVEHGIGPAGGGHIGLRAFRAGEELRVEVHNDGAPLSEEELARLARLMEAEGPGGGHVGIRNVNQRLQLLFPGQAGLRISRAADGHTVAEIHLPFTEQEPENSPERSGP